MADRFFETSFVGVLTLERQPQGRGSDASDPRRICGPRLQEDDPEGGGVWGLGVGVWGLGFGVWGLGFRV